MALALVGSIADAAGLKGVGPATDLATHRRAVDRSSETALTLLHRASPALANAPALAMTPATANACHGPSVRIGRRNRRLRATRSGDAQRLARSDIHGRKSVSPMAVVGAPAAFSAPPLVTTPATVSASHGASVRIGQDTGQANQQTNVHPAALALDPERLQSGDRTRYILSMERPGFVGVVRNGGEI
jgi:hypothetical protein